MNRCLVSHTLCEGCKRQYWLPEKIPIVKAGQLHFRIPEKHILKLSCWFIASGKPTIYDLEIFYQHGKTVEVIPCDTVPWDCYNSKYHPYNKDIVPVWV